MDRQILISIPGLIFGRKNQIRIMHGFPSNIFLLRALKCIAIPVMKFAWTREKPFRIERTLQTRILHERKTNDSRFYCYIGSLHPYLHILSIFLTVLFFYLYIKLFLHRPSRSFLYIFLICIT